MERGTSIVVGVIICLFCCLSSSCLLLFTALTSPHRNEIDDFDFATISQALSWYGECWLKWEWIGVTPEMWNCVG